MTTRWVYPVVMGGIIVVSIALGFARFFYIDADPPTSGVAWDGGAFCGDEGLWYRNAIWQATHNQWYLKDSYNPAVLVPVMPALAMATEAVSGQGELTRTALRALTAGIVLLGIAVCAVAVYRRCGVWPGVLTALLLASSFTLFVHSRVAVVDAPASVFMVVGLSLLLGWPQARPVPATVLAAVVGVIAVLTKSTMLVAVPAYVVAAWMLPGRGAPRWRDPLLVLAIGGGLLAAYGLGVIWCFPGELSRFRQANMTPTSVSLSDGSHRVMASGNYLGRWLFLLLIVCLPVGLWRMRGRPGYPWLAAGLVWILLIAAAIVWKGYFPPRYFVPMIWPATIIVGVVTGQAILADQRRLAGMLVLALVLMVSAQDAIDIARALRKPRWSWRDMGIDLRQKLDSLGGPQQWTLIGGWPADNVGFVAGVPNIGNYSLVTEYGQALEQYPVAFLVEWDDQYLSREMTAAIETRYEYGETFEYTIIPEMDNYRSRPIRVTRLLPRSENPRDAG